VIAIKRAHAAASSSSSASSGPGVGGDHWRLGLVSSADVGRTYLREDRGAARRGRVAGDRRRLLEGRGV